MVSDNRKDKASAQAKAAVAALGIVIDQLSDCWKK